MSHTLAALLAMTASFLVAMLIAVWYAVPWLKAKPVAMALTALAWVHVFRYVALLIAAAQSDGLGISHGLRDQIMYGDLVCAVLALGSIVVLRTRADLAGLPLWSLVVITVVDLINAVVGGIREGAFETATDVAWLVLTFYVPVLWVTTGLIVWVLMTRGAKLRSPR